MPSPLDGNNLLCFTPSYAYLSLSDSVGFVPSQIFSSIVFSVPFLAQAEGMFGSRLEFELMNGQSINTDAPGLGEWHLRPSNSFVQLDGMP